jgi:hypothetical protein
VVDAAGPVVGREPKTSAVRCLLLVATLLAFGLLSVWGEWLWFRALDLETRFWLFLGALSASLAAGGLLAMLICQLITGPVDNRRFVTRRCLRQAWRAPSGAPAAGPRCWFFCIAYLPG